MTRTAPVVSFGLYALTVKQDSSFTCADLQPWSKLSDLKTDNATSLPYVSYEPSFWLLDGGYHFKPADSTTVHVGLMSLSMSDGAGAFAVAPVLTVDFSTAQSSDGLTLRFAQYSGDWASSVTVDYYDAGAALIRTDTYTPSTWELITGQAVADFKQIVITFTGTNKPYRYLRLEGIDFGTLIYFRADQVKAATVVEEIDPLTGEARYNTLDLRLYSADANFSPLNPQGAYQYLQQYQPIAVHETVGNQTLYIGQFYTDTWDNKSPQQIEFNCIDLLGVLETVTFMGNLYFGTLHIEDVIDSMLSAIHAPYDLDAALYGTTITGWIPICSYRQALQQIAFACGAYLDCSRSGSLKIYKAPDLSTATPSATITRAQKSMSQNVGVKPLVTGVEVTAHNYVVTSTSKQVYNGTLAAGDYTVTFTEPLHTLSISGATITASTYNYATIHVASPGTVILSGQVYLDTQSVYSVTMPALPAGTKPNIKKITDATLVSSANAQAAAQRVYDYYQNRITQKFRMYAPTTVEVGDVVLVDTQYGQQIKSIVEKMSLDLCGGMTADCELSGVVV